jgi:hypothetical protein
MVRDSEAIVFALLQSAFTVHNPNARSLTLAECVHCQEYTLTGEA